MNSNKIKEMVNEAESKDIFDLMISGCELEHKEIYVCTIANLLKICGIASEYIRLNDLVVNYNEVDREHLNEIYNKKDICVQMLDDELKLIDNFVATLAIGDYIRNYDEKSTTKNKIEIITNIMKTSNEVIEKLKNNMNKMVNEQTTQQVKTE